MYEMNSQPKQLFNGFADMLNSSAVKPLISPAGIPSLGFRINIAVEILRERQKPEKNCAMKETSLHTSNTDAIATDLASVSENLCVQLSMPKTLLINRKLNRHHQKNNMNGLLV